uniref:Growth hormone-inducible transmembrane protein n=1 Tax=Heterorhabditis bacteriophora TaxID=37862 RepID=A0A1I7X3H2_HETBA
MLSRLVLRTYPLSIRPISNSSTKFARFGGGSSGFQSRFSQQTVYIYICFGFGVRVAPTLKERLLGPTTGKPFLYGTYALAGASLFGVGALMYYGLISKETSILQNSALWPKYVCDRLSMTYSYLAGSLAVTAASGVAATRSPAIMRITQAGGLMASAMGAVLAPMCYLGGPVLMRAAWYTAGIVAGLSATAITAPSEKFLMISGPLAMGLGVVFVANIGTFFLPPGSALGAGKFSLFNVQIFLHFLFIYFVKSMISSTRALIRLIFRQLSIYMDVLNIFIRMAMIMSGMGGNRRK